MMLSLVVLLPLLCVCPVHSFGSIGTRNKFSLFTTTTTTTRVFSESSSSSTTISSGSSLVLSSVPQRLSRDEALLVLNRDILPTEEYGDRIGYGRDAQGIVTSELVQGNDPRLTLTYGEFPTHSMDQLVDLALRHVAMDDYEKIEMVDLGSGCGRLVFYAALSRGTPQQPWNIRGIEISPLLHDIATKALQAGQDWFVDTSATTTTTTNTLNTCELVCGPAQNHTDWLRQADVVFAYSTVWQTSGFSPQLGAMVMDRSWSELLATSCRPGCVVVTTDRALDPQHGWKLLNQLNVDNREVMGSTGYIQTLV